MRQYLGALKEPRQSQKGCLIRQKKRYDFYHSTRLNYFSRAVHSFGSCILEVADFFPSALETEKKLVFSFGEDCSAL